ncbi:MAG: TlpA disulfide reductase family protein [Bacteroidota bacterium]
MNSKRLYPWLTVSNIFTALLVSLIISMILFPDVKATVISGLMKVGLFRPNVPSLTGGTSEENFPLAPDIEFYNENDSSLSLTSLKGKVVFINFWATWCPPCIAEMPGINELHNKVSTNSNIVFIITDADGDLKKSGKIIADHGYHLPLFKAGSAVPSTIFSGTLPTTLVVNKKGEIVFHEQGVANYDTKKFEEFLQKLASE